MLQLLVCSDVHTYVNNITLAMHKADRIDAVLIAGDIEAEQDQLQASLGETPYYAVCGNNDYYLNTDYPEELLIDITDSPSYGRPPSIANVTPLQYSRLPDKYYSLPDILRKKAPFFLRPVLAGEKRGPDISHRILMTHGKEYNVPETKYLSRRADLWDADLVIFGHTHKYAEIIDNRKKRRFLNPGCLIGDPFGTVRRWGNYEICSFALLRIGLDGEISIQHLYVI